jgi:glutamate dehydrogenase/leucine dehydrogenase
MEQTVHDYIERAGKHLGLSEDQIAKLKKPDAEHIFDITLDNGNSFKAYRVQHSNKRGPYKGGIRFHPDVNLEEVRTLATLMSLKTAAVNIPLGGGKGGVAIDPRNVSDDELKEVSQKYVQNLYEHIGPDQDIPAPDVNTNAQIIDWMVEEYERLTGDTSKASFTGKSIANGGSLGREAATGRGGVMALKELLRLEDADRPLRFAVQGFGNVGSFFATVASELYPDWKMVAASDSEAAVCSEDGLDPVALQEFKASRGRFKDYASGNVKIISNDDLLALDVDVLVLAGFENTVTDKNAELLKAHYITELANGPITREAHEYLVAKGHIILPDIIANAGGVVVSYLEWLQNKAGEKWDEDKVNNQLQELITAAVKEVYDYSKSNGIELNEAAYALAIKKLV